MDVSSSYRLLSQATGLARASSSSARWLGRPYPSVHRASARTSWASSSISQHPRAAATRTATTTTARQPGLANLASRPRQLSRPLDQARSFTTTRLILSSTPHSSSSSPPGSTFSSTTSTSSSSPQPQSFVSENDGDQSQEPATTKQGTYSAARPYDGVAEGVRAQQPEEVAAPSPDARGDVPAYELTFTCKPCLTRSVHRISKHGYHNGTVLVTCPQCKNRHVISDHLKIFNDASRSFEEILSEKGLDVKKGTLDPDRDVELWHDGTQTQRAK